MHYEPYLPSAFICGVCIHLVEVGALGGPHGRGAQAEDEGCGDEGVELGVELGRHVGRVAEDAHHQRPLHLEVLDEDAGHEHAGQDEADVDRGGGPGAQVVHHVDGALQLAHGLEGGEEQQEGEEVCHEHRGLDGGSQGQGNICEEAAILLILIVNVFSCA